MTSLIKKKTGCEKNGGARKGAGRPPGSCVIKSRAIADKASEQGITPLEVMLNTMREALELGGNEAAFPFAKEIAPYMHPRIAAIELTGKDGKELNLIKNFNIRLVSPDADDI
jgi:hypothetical protein